MKYIFIKATGQSEGDLHLLDATNWNVSKALISYIRVVTSSTDWDLYILQNDNGYAADDANIPKMQIMEGGNGNANILLNLPYCDEDGTNEVHLYYLDNSGANTATFYILGVNASMVLDTNGYVTANLTSTTESQIDDIQSEVGEWGHYPNG